MENLIDVYEYDAQGYFSGTTFEQVDDDTREVIAMPPNCTLIKPECNDKFFYKFDGEKWVAEKIPTTAEECVGIVISHESHTPHDVTMKKLFTALTKDSQTHRVVHGDNWEWSVEAIPAPTPEEEESELAAKVRAQRDELISETDYLLMADYPISEEELAAVKTYRQALRDVPQQDGFPNDVVWPEKPDVQNL